MSFIANDARGVDYCLCRYGASKIDFRGPKARLDSRYIALLGGGETFGRNVSKPFAAQLQVTLNTPCVNFGVMNAGLDLFLKAPEVLGIAERAEAVVLQILGAQNMSNRYYAVHPRRNDRFLRASDVLMDMYPDLDFTEFHYNKHLLERLHSKGRDRFSLVRSELSKAWVARMKHMLSLFPCPVILLWLAPHRPDAWIPDDFRMDPLFVGRPMIEELTNHKTHLVEVQMPVTYLKNQYAGGWFGGAASLQAEDLNAVATHKMISDQLSQVLQTVF